MTINQTIEFDCSPSALYRALTSGGAFAEATGAPAEIEATEGAAFSCFGGQITGRQLDITPNERIVQAWRAGPWPDGAYSIVRFDIAASGDGAVLTLEHAGYPDDMGGHLDDGWHKMYWEPLKQYLS